MVLLLGNTLMLFIDPLRGVDTGRFQDHPKLDPGVSDPGVENGNWEKKNEYSENFFFFLPERNKKE